MKRVLLSSVLLIFAAGMVGCQDAIIPCYDNMDVSCERAAQIPPLEADVLVCNMAMTLEQVCQDYLGMLPTHAPIPDICAYIPSEDVGTCQAPGEATAPCVEDADCGEGLTCSAGVCE